MVTEQANRLVREKQVDFLAGTFSSAERNAAAPVATQANKLLLYPTFYEGQSQKFYPGVCNPNIFMFGPEPSEQVWPHMDYIVKKHGGKFFMIGSDYAWPRETNRLTKDKLEELGGSVVGEVYIPFNTPQYGSVLNQIRRLRRGRHLPLADRIGHRELPTPARRRRYEEGLRGVDGRRRGSRDLRHRPRRDRGRLRQLRLLLVHRHTEQPGVPQEGQAEVPRASS